MGKGIACTKALRHESADCLVNCKQLRRGRKQEGCRSGEGGKGVSPQRACSCESKSLTNFS